MASPDASSKSFASLPEVLRGRRIAALVVDAELIRDAPAGEDRNDEARRAIREAMLLFALRRITRAERDRVLDILSFVTVRDAPESEQSPTSDGDHNDTYGPLV